MLIKFLCKRFNLIPRTDFADKLVLMMYKMELERDILKAQYDHKSITEWSYYRDVWNLRGKLQMLEELIEKLGE